MAVGEVVEMVVRLLRPCDAFVVCLFGDVCSAVRVADVGFFDKKFQYVFWRRLVKIRNSRTVNTGMGRYFLEHLGGRRIFSCDGCKAFLTNEDELISKHFTGSTGPAFLFDRVVNIEYSEMQLRTMITGRHIVRDVICKRCKTKLGWMYEYAMNEPQKYKESKVILERALIEMSEGIDNPVDDGREPRQRNFDIYLGLMLPGIAYIACFWMFADSYILLVVWIESLMTILPNKPKKIPKNTERHGLQQTCNRAVSIHSHRHSSTNNSNDEKRKINVTGSAGSKSSSLARATFNKSNHFLGASSPEANKQPRQSPPVENPGAPVINSDDEDGSGFKDDNLEAWFEERLRCARGLVIKPVRGDGACLFRAVADQIYGDEEMHDDVRRLCMDYMEKNSDHFSQFVTEDFRDYIARKRRHDAHGNHVELQAISEIFSRPIEIYEYCIEPRNISSSRLDASPSTEANPPIRLSYHGSIHYNSVIDPTKATVGVGLGLPEYSPGAADRNLLQEAMQKSEVQMIEDAMLHDKIKMTDFERTEQEISEQIARQSYLDYLKSISKVENTEIKGTAYAVSEPGCSHANVRLQENSDDSIGANEWFHAAGSDAEENALLAQVMALSQQEFLNSLKKKSKKQNDADQAGSSKSS
ncbi:unnamed protein product [Litomosoides sigmodontis]|uniref:ubiquitinyl hydrolase 1 n=1 Tax=Litomosoides sigmodontis TaxID=42156 RepID=A0A3P6S4V3_LITSI|nr:unnamed protein product [Litomosoides sigmodontis]